MANLMEQLTIASFVGRPVNPEALARLTEVRKNGSGPYADCTEYSIDLQKQARNPARSQTLGITAGQAEDWGRDCARFLLSVYEKDGLFAGAHIGKRLRTELLANGYETEPSGEDLQVIQCLLRNITGQVANNGSD